MLAIRAALSHPRDIEAFETSLPIVVDRARAERDWSGLDDFVLRWWMIACDSLRDPAGRAVMWDTVDRLDRGEPVETVPWEDVEAMLRDRLARGV